MQRWNSQEATFCISYKKPALNESGKRTVIQMEVKKSCHPAFKNLLSKRLFGVHYRFIIFCGFVFQTMWMFQTKGKNWKFPFQWSKWPTMLILQRNRRLLEKSEQSPVNPASFSASVCSAFWTSCRNTEYSKALSSDLLVTHTGSSAMVQLLIAAFYA